MICTKEGHLGQGPPGLALYIIICYTVSGPENKKPKNTLSIVVQFLPRPEYIQIYTHSEPPTWTACSQMSPHAAFAFVPFASALLLGLLVFFAFVALASVAFATEPIQAKRRLFRPQGPKSGRVHSGPNAVHVLPAIGSSSRGRQRRVPALWNFHQTSPDTTRHPTRHSKKHVIYNTFPPDVSF